MPGEEREWKLQGVDEEAGEADCPSCGQTVPLSVAKHIAEQAEKAEAEAAEARERIEKVRDWAEKAKVAAVEREKTHPEQIEGATECYLIASVILDLLPNPPTGEAQKETDEQIHGFSVTDASGKRIDPSLIESLPLHPGKGRTDG